MCMCLCISQAWAQNRTITGKVTGDNKQPLFGASVSVKGTTIGTITDEHGSFTLTVLPTAKTLLFTAIGFENKEISIGDRTAVDVQMTSSNSVLSEVVVVGYQTIRKKDLTAAISSISSKELSDKPLPTFTQLLQGQATGVQVTTQSGRPGVNAYIRVRGIGSINAAPDPLIIVDGLPVSTTAFALVNPDDIDDVTVLKDASATAIYGSRGGNGVVVVSTDRKSVV